MPASLKDGDRAFATFATIVLMLRSNDDSLEFPSREMLKVYSSP